MINLLQNLNLVGILYTCSFYFMLEHYEFEDIYRSGYLRVELLLLIGLALNIIGLFIEKSSLLALVSNLLWGNIGTKLIISSGEEFKIVLGKFIRVRGEEEKLEKLDSWISNDNLVLSDIDQILIAKQSKNFDDLLLNYIKFKESIENNKKSENFIYEGILKIYEIVTTNYIATGAIVLAMLGLCYHFYIGGMSGTIVNNLNSQNYSNSKLSEKLINEISSLKSKVDDVEKISIIHDELLESLKYLFELDEKAIFSMYELFRRIDETDSRYLALLGKRRMYTIHSFILP